MTFGTDEQGCTKLFFQQCDLLGKIALACVCILCGRSQIAVFHDVQKRKNHLICDHDLLLLYILYRNIKHEI